MKKGDPLYVEGRLQYRPFQDEEGTERGVTEIVAGDVQFLKPRKDRSTTPEPEGQQPAGDEVLPILR